MEWMKSAEYEYLIPKKIILRLVVLIDSNLVHRFVVAGRRYSSRVNS